MIWTCDAPFPVHHLGEGASYAGTVLYADLGDHPVDTMTPAPALIAPSVQAFFVEHLPQHKRLSPQTIASCRDTFRLLLHFMQHTRGIEPAALRVTDLDAP